jgi:hypothetical protein
LRRTAGDAKIVDVRVKKIRELYSKARLKPFDIVLRNGARAHKR